MLRRNGRICPFEGEQAAVDNLPGANAVQGGGAGFGGIDDRLAECAAAKAIDADVWIGSPRLNPLRIEVERHNLAQRHLRPRHVGSRSATSACSSSRIVSTWRSFASAATTIA